jgi:hypothetical protein
MEIAQTGMSRRFQVAKMRSTRSPASAGATAGSFAAETVCSTTNKARVLARLDTGILSDDPRVRRLVNYRGSK